MKGLKAMMVCGLLVCTIIGVSAIAIAPKPPRPPPGGTEPTGTIFYRYNDGGGDAIWTMNADGSQKTKQVIEDGVDFDGIDYPGVVSSTVVFGMPSRITHGDHYWYLRFEGIYDVGGNPETYPDGLGRREIFAVKDDNSMKVQLTNDPTLASWHDALWGIGDNSVSWGAKRWVEGQSIPTDSGIYAVDLEWDENGDLAGTTGQVSWVWDTGMHYLDEGWWSAYVPSMSRPFGHDWSPDEMKIAYTSLDAWALRRVDLDIGEESWLIDGAIIYGWSPDGSKIAYRNYDFSKPEGTYTINPDGTGERLIVAERDSKSGWSESFFGNQWSPDSKFLVYRSSMINYRVYPPKTQSSINTVRVEDGSQTSISDGGTPIAWR